VCDVIICILSIIGATIPNALAGTCDNAVAPQAEIRISKSEVQEAYDITRADIQRRAESAGKPAPWPGLGASSADMGYRAEISENAVQERDGSYCATPDRVRVVIELKNRIMHLAQEAKQKPCLERIQRERLQKLARADEQGLEEFPIEARMRSLLAQIGPRRAQTELMARAEVTTAVREKIQTLLDEVQDRTAKIRVNIADEIDRLRQQVETDPNCR